MLCKQYIIITHMLSEKTASSPQPLPTTFPAAFPAAFPAVDLHILKISCSIFHEKCISEANCSLIFTYDPPNQSLEPPLQDRNSLIMF